MKGVLCLAFLACVALTFGEECQDVDDCTHVTCPDSDYTLECHLRTCTCSHPTATCADADDCEDADDRCNRDWHCVDGQCRCGFGFGGGPVGGGGGGGPGRR